MKIELWHNPDCGSSRNALAWLRERGVEPALYLYLEAKPDRAAIEAVLERLGLPPSGLLRPKEPAGEALGLYEAGVDEARILDAMVRESRLIQRPVVLTPKGAVIARPKERLAALIEPLL